MVKSKRAHSNVTSNRFASDDSDELKQSSGDAIGPGGDGDDTSAGGGAAAVTTESQGYETHGLETRARARSHRDT